MEAALAITFLFFNLLLHPHPFISHPQCTDSRAPFNNILSFCPYNGNTCCNTTQDFQLQKQFRAMMNFSSPGGGRCASILKSVLCAKCDPFSGELFAIDSAPRTVPVLCNSTVSANSSQSSQEGKDFCSKVWDTCENVSVVNSPFVQSLQDQAGIVVNSNTTKLTYLWQSRTHFCNAFGGASTNESVCFDGEPVAFNNTAGTYSDPHGLCLEKIGDGTYLNMVAHPDGSDRAFFSSHDGKIWLAKIPDQGSGGTLGIDEADPFVDLTDGVLYNITDQFRMTGMAFHPNFAENGRFFASFNCDKVKWPGCTGRCSCNSDVYCDTEKLPLDSGPQPCQYQIVVAEYTANGTAAQVSLATSATPLEVRRIFSMGLPFKSDYGGQILFGPDGYLYLMMGDGGRTIVADSNYFAQNKRSLLGKIMRLDVDNIPSPAEVEKLGRWGNYSIPKDNPYTEDSNLQPEIWALGLRNPWRCSFDSERPSYFMCADIGQDVYQEVDIISKGGNYGWPIYKGPFPFLVNTSLKSINPISPVMGYIYNFHGDPDEATTSIIGGYFYRSKTDPCTYGSYLYADFFAGTIWAGTETPENSGNFTSNSLHFSCAKDTPIECATMEGGAKPSLKYIFSFGEDNNKDIFILTRSSGVYRVVRPTRCSFTCEKETSTAAQSSTHGISGNILRFLFIFLFFFFLSSLLLLLGLIVVMIMWRLRGW